MIWGVSQVVNKKGLDSLTPLMYNLVVTAIGLLVYLSYASFRGFNVVHFRLSDFLLLTFVTATYLLYLYIVSLGQISLTGTIWASYPVTTVICSVIFLGEKVSLNQVFFIALILLGVALIGLPQKIADFKAEKWFWLALGGAALIGVSDFLAKFVINRNSVGDYFFWYSLAMLPGMILVWFLDKKGRVWPKVPLQIWLTVLLGGLLLELGNVFFFTAFSKGPVSLISPIVSSYQAITVVLALVFLKEKLRKTQALGVALAVLGIILIGA